MCVVVLSVVLDLNVCVIICDESLRFVDCVVCVFVCVDCVVFECVCCVD